MIRRLLWALVVLLAAVSCSHNVITMDCLLRQQTIEARYLRSDGRWVPADSLSWRDRCWYRELRFDTDGDGEWNYLYGEIYDDVAGWVWVPSSARINPEEEPDLAARKRHLARQPGEAPCDPSLDDFGYPRR